MFRGFFLGVTLGFGCSTKSQEVCQPDQYRDGPTGTCQSLTTCLETQYESHPATEDQDRHCSETTDCQAGEYVATSATATTDQICHSCTLHENYSTETNAPQCTAVTECLENQYISLSATLQSDQQCGDCEDDVVVANGHCLTCSDAQTCTTIVCAQGYAPAEDSCQDVVPPENTSCVLDDAEGKTCTCADGFHGEISWDDGNSRWVGSCTTWTDCPPGSFVSGAGTTVSDRQCSPCTENLTFSATTNAPECTPVTDCGAGEYVLTTPTLSSDRNCEECTLNTDFSTTTNAPECTPLTDCVAGEYVLNTPTLSSDRNCEGCVSGVSFSNTTNADWCTQVGNCTQGEYVVAKPTPTSDRSCAPCTLNADFSTTTNAPECTPVTDCGAGEYVLTTPTLSSDRNCEECTLNTDFSTTTNAPECTPLTDCVAGEYVLTTPTLSSDRNCEECTLHVDYSNTVNSAQCSLLSDCQPGEYIYDEATLSSDRSCEECTLNIDFSTTTNATSCSPVQTCATNEYEHTAPSLTENRVCEVLIVEMDVVDSQAFEGGLDPAEIHVYLSEVQSQDVVISYTLGGSAEHNIDYQLLRNGAPLTNPFTIPAGQSGLDIVIEPLASAALEVTETVIFSLEGSSAFDVGTDSVGEVSIVEYGPSNGIVYFVDEQGDDSNSGSEAFPFATIAHAVAQLTAGDTLYIKDGTYTNSGYTEDHGSDGNTQISNPLLARVTSSGDADNWITIAAYPDGNDIRPLLKFDGQGGIQINSGANYIRIEGLEIQGPNAGIEFDWAHDHRWSKENFYTGRGIYSWGPVHHVVVKDCNVHHTPGSGIRFNKADYILVEQNIVSNTTWWSSSAESAIVIATAEAIDTEDVVKFLYSGNVVYNNWNFLEFCSTPFRYSTDDEYGNCDYYTGGIIDGQGLYVTRNNNTYLHGRMRFENNIAFNNGFGGVVYHKTDRGELVNNLVFMNGAYPGTSNYTGMTVNTSDDLVIVNNLIWARDSNDYGLKNNGNASNVVSTNNYIVGRSQFGTAADNMIIDFIDAEDFSVVFSDVQDISIAHPDPLAISGDFAPANIDAFLRSYALDFALVNTAVDLIDAGSSTYAPSVDIDYTVRPQNADVDIGPHEFVGAP